MPSTATFYKEPTPTPYVAPPTPYVAPPTNFVTPPPMTVRPPPAIYVAPVAPAPVEPTVKRRRKSHALPQGHQYPPSTQNWFYSDYMAYVTLLSPKYPNVCSSTMSFQMNPITGFNRKSMIAMTGERTRSIHTPNEFSFVFPTLLCNKPFIVFRLGLFTDAESSADGHANLVIVNKSASTWEIERFDPHGTVDMPHVEVYKKLGEQFDQYIENNIIPIFKKYGKNINYLRPMQVCPVPGIQAKGEEKSDYGGFCQSWSLVYMDHRLSNPQMTGNQILTELLKLPHDSLHSIVQEMNFNATNYRPTEMDKQITNLYFKLQSILCIQLDKLIDVWDKERLFKTYTTFMEAIQEIITRKLLTNGKALSELILYTNFKGDLEPAPTDDELKTALQLILTRNLPESIVTDIAGVQYPRNYQKFIDLLRK